MPKKFTDSEKEYISKRLKEEAGRCMMIYGIKKTTVDELVKRVNIPKGTFYLLYESKEILFFEVINEIHEELQTKLFHHLESLSDEITPDIITDTLFQIYQEFNKTGLLAILLGGELELIMRKLPEDKVSEHLKHDDISVEKLFSFLPIKDVSKIEVFSAALRAVFMTLLHQREIGEEVFEDALRLMLRGIVLQLMEEDHD